MTKKANKDPAIIFYTSDFLTGCADLTMEERGQYITMLCLQHQHGPLSKKIITLNIPSISESVLEKFSIDKNGNYFNKRLEKEIEKRKEHSKKQRENVMKRWAKRDIPSYIPNKNQSETKNIPLENEIGNGNDNKINNIKLYEFIENNFNRKLAPLEISKISDWLEIFDEQAIKYAISIAVNNNAKTISYVEGILRNWTSLNLKKYDEIMNHLDQQQKVKREKIELYEYDWLNESQEE